MKELLFLSHRIPYPPNKGDKLRSFNLLKQLSRNYRVHVGAFIDDQDDWRHAEAVRAMAGGECYFARLRPWSAKLRSLPALLGSAPLSLPYYRDAALRRWVDRLLAGTAVSQAIVFSGAMAQYIDGPAYRRLRRIVDFVDVDSDKWQQYARSQTWPMSWIYRREARTLLSYERRIAAAVEASVFVSNSEAELFRKLAPEAAARVWDIHNGVDTVYFDPALEHPSPYSPAEKAIVFTGAMDYWANVDAVTWFAREIFPAVRERVAAAQFYIVGARATGDVQQLARLPGVQVTGAVKDIRPYLAHARVAVAPLRIARGVQNKVLEAMAMAKPVIVTPQALDGILCRADEEVILVEDAATFVDKVCAILATDGAGSAEVARRRVIKDYSWESNLLRFQSLLEDESPKSTENRNAAAEWMMATDLGGK